MSDKHAKKNSANIQFSVIPHVEKLRAGVHQNFIDGLWTDVSGGVWQHVHPASGESDFTVAIANESDVDRAVRAARRAFDEGPWPRLRARERKLLLRPIGDIVRKHAEELNYRQTLDNGVPISLGKSYRFSAYIAADIFEYFAGWIDKLDGSVPPVFSDKSNIHYMSVKEPLGVVAAITPFNAPVMQFAYKLAPALAAGCTVVIKPSEYTSNVAAFYMKLIEELGLPPGVVNLVTGTAATGASLVGHPLVDKIAFTGHHAVGREVLTRAASNFKRVSLELGGKSPSIFFSDIPDPAAAGRHAMSLVSMGLSGQVCSTQTRAIVHKSIYNEFVAGAASQVNVVRYGDPFDPATTSAPLITPSAAKRVIDHIEQAKREKARLVTGGRKWIAAPEGNWVEPTLFADVDNTMTIAREELFGPVLCVIPFESEEEAIRIANDSEYGLSGGVYTENPTRAVRVARALRTGTVAINGVFSMIPSVPFGGFKASGIRREGGREGIEEYLETKTISLPLDS